MNNRELAASLRRNMVETGSLMCLGCGHEHNCATKGCAIMREAAERIEQMDATIQALKAENEGIRQNSVSHDALKALMGEDILKTLEQRVREQKAG